MIGSAELERESLAELRALANLGSIVSGDDPRRAREVDREGLALARRVGHRMMANWLTGGAIVDAFVAAEDWDLVLAMGDEALAAVTDPGDEQRILAFATLIRVCRGEPTDEAITRLEELAEAGATSDPGDEQMLRIVRGTRSEAAGDLRAAYDEAIGAVLQGPRRGPVWNLLPNEHDAAWSGVADRPVYTVRFLEPGSGGGLVAVSHWNKFLKGALVRFLVEHPGAGPAELAAWEHPAGYVLEFTDGLPGVFTNSLLPVVVEGEHNVVIDPTEVLCRAYRLRKVAP